MPWRRNSKKKELVLLMKYAGEGFGHRRHRFARKKKVENNKERKKRLEQLLLEEHNKELKNVCLNLKLENLKET
jgi:hypothetical protein